MHNEEMSKLPCVSLFQIFGIYFMFKSWFFFEKIELTAVLRFWAPFLEGGLGETYNDHLRLIGKRVVDFLLVLIELFSLGVTAEALQA